MLQLTLLSLIAIAGQSDTPDVEKGKVVFQACRYCHNVLTDGRKAGPSLRTLFGKVLLVNGKRAIEQNVVQLITEGYNGMPSYRYLLRPDDWEHLLAYLKTLRGRPEINPVLKPIRGSDDDILAAGKKHFSEHCGSCHEVQKLLSGEPVKESAVVSRTREGHGGMPSKKDILDDADLFALMAFLKAQ